MTFQLILLAIFLAVMAVWFTAEGIRGKKKKIRQLKSQFGKVPSGDYRRAGTSHYWEGWRALCSEQGLVDERTWDDLEMEDLFDRINACRTLVGEGYLYALLHRRLGAEEQQEQEELLSQLEDEPFRLQVQTELLRLGKRTGIDLPSLLYDPESYALEGERGLTLFALLPLASLPLFPFFPSAGAALLLGALGHNIWRYLKIQKKLEGRLETISYQLAVFALARRLQKLFRTRCPQRAAKLGQLAALSDQIGKTMVLLSPSPQSNGYLLVQMLGILTLFPILQYRRAVRIFDAERAKTQALFEQIGEIDAAQAILSYRHSLPLWTTPVFEEKLSIRAESLLHPLLTESDCVPNDAQIEANWLLTGSNASGKSTFIKAVALNAILAQSIHTCTASRFVLCRAAVVTSMAARDDLSAGESYFVAEIKSMRRVVALAGGAMPFYCFIDEVLKGTNTAERVAASCAVLRYLCRPGCLCVAATHDLELTELLGDRYENRHFSEQVGEQGVTFDYKLKEGPCRTTNAIRLLGYYDFPPVVVAEAKNWMKRRTAPESGREE